MSDSRVLGKQHDVPELQPGLTTAPDPRGAVRLIGQRCEDCGTRFFPARMRCVSCYRGNIHSTELARIGKVDAFTIVRQAPPGYHGQMPYVLGMVKVDNDVVTLCHLTGKCIEDWRRGDTVACYAMILPVGISQEPRRTYSFRPATAQDLA